MEFDVDEVKQPRPPASRRGFVSHSRRVDGGTHGERSERGSSAHTGLVSGRRYIASANGPPPFKPIYTGVLYIIHLDNG